MAACLLGASVQSHDQSPLTLQAGLMLCRLLHSRLVATGNAELSALRHRAMRRAMLLCVLLQVRTVAAGTAKPSRQKQEALNMRLSQRSVTGCTSIACMTMIIKHASSCHALMPQGMAEARLKRKGGNDEVVAAC